MTQWNSDWFLPRPWLQQTDYCYLRQQLSPQHPRNRSYCVDKRPARREERRNFCFLDTVFQAFRPSKVQTSEALKLCCFCLSNSSCFSCFMGRGRGGVEGKGGSRRMKYLLCLDPGSIFSNECRKSRWVRAHSPVALIEFPVDCDKGVSNHFVPPPSPPYPPNASCAEHWKQL